MTPEEKVKLEERIVDVLKTVYDPEIPVNIFDLGMIYKIDVKDDETESQQDLDVKTISQEDLGVETTSQEDLDVTQEANVELDMTFTAPNCPAADFILEDVRTKVESVEGVKACIVNLVFEPAWDQSMMTEEARVELGFE